MRRLVPLLLAISGCSHDVDRDAIAAAPTVATAVQAPLHGTPHGGSIREVAVTESGDGAISVDQQGGIRVWPALDGSREAVPVIAPAPVEIAIARHGDEFVAGLIDDAGSAQVLRIGRDGRLRGRSAVAGEVRIEQIVAMGDGLVVRRADQSLERLDATGAMRERLVAEPGERIAAVAVRGDAAIAVIAGVDGTSNRVRWIGSDFTWGTRVTLPSPVWPDSVALSPSHKRLAGAEGTSRQLFVFDLSVKPAVVLGTSVTVGAGEPTGFVDDDHVVAMGLRPRWWTSLAQPNVDPWAPTTPPNPPDDEVSPGSIGAAATGFMVAGSGASLALITPSRVRYLGWQDIGSQGELVLGKQIAVTVTASRIAWLDSELVAQHVATISNGQAYVQPIDDRHVVIVKQRDTEQEVAMIDIDHPEHEVELGVFTAIQRYDYEPHTHVFGVADPGGEHRYELDPARGTAKHLTDLSVRSDTTYFRLLDPALADGAVGLQVLTDPSSRIDVFHEGHRTPVAHRSGGPGYAFAIDDRGHVYSREGASTVFREGVPFAKDIADMPVPDHGGDAIATVGGYGVAMYDAAGHQRWRHSIWGATSAAFTTDDQQLVVRAPGGLVMLDVDRGARVASACGWGFGLHDTPPTTAPTNQGSVCEDDE